jgi:xylulokinase
VLALDLGTGSVKAGLVGPDGDLVAQAARPYAVLAPQPGWSESDPHDWWAGVVAATREVLAGVNPARVQAIGLSGQMHGVVLVDAGEQALGRAVLWSDTRSAGHLDPYRAVDPGRLRNPPVAGFAGPTLLRLRGHEPERYAAARWALQPKDWLRLHLTGEAASDPSDASGTLLYDFAADDWDSELLGTLDLRPDLLPPLWPSGSVGGTLRLGRAADLGLPVGLPVAVGAADTAAALLGSGLRPGEAQLTVGTGAQVLRASGTLPPARPGLNVFCDAQGGFYTLGAVQNAGNVLEWVRRTLRLSWPEMYAAAQEVEQLPSPLFLPYLSGDRTPHLDPHARAGWLRLDASHDHRHLAYAAFEGVALSVAQATAALELPADLPLRLAGGGSVDPWWRQLLADALGRPLHISDVPGASLLGAAALAWQAIGEPWTPERPDITGVVQPGPGRISAGRHAEFAAAYRAVRGEQ